ncbi:MAG: hypothetical protein QOG50_2980 [Actinomycetota bacterium]|jgi:hypothetical protein|nr:hypothetical protein [Actinomycetota bacterium]
MTKRDWAVVATAGVVGVSSFLHWIASNSAWSNQFAPLVYVVHVPVVLLGLFVALQATGSLPRSLAAIPDRILLQMVSVVALVGSLTGLVFQLQWRSSICSPGACPGGTTSAGIGGILTVIGTVVLVIVIWFGERIPILQENRAAQFISSDPSLIPIEPRWVGLDEPYETPDGRRLGTDDWYLAIATSNGCLVLQVADGAEIVLPPGRGTYESSG